MTTKDKVQHATHYDLVIVGGGLVGTGLALALKSAGLRIALIDASHADKKDPRLFALNNSSCQFLENIGAWPQLSTQAEAIHQVHASYSGRFGATRLTREDAGLSSLGHVIPAHLIESAMNTLLVAAATTSHIQLYRPATLQTISQQHGMATLTLLVENEQQRNLQAPLVIAADGAESTIRTQLQFETQQVDYQQSAIVTRTLLQRSHQHIAYERFNAQGAIAMLPLSGNECATIWSADNGTIAELSTLTDHAFLQSLQKQFGYRLGRLQKISQRHVFPLRMLRAKKMVDQCVLLLGNAAHTLHPIAAQGFNLALYEVAMLAEEILKKISTHDVFSSTDLHDVGTQIERHQRFIIGVSHGLAQLFATNSWVNFALPAGMVGLDIATPLKKNFVNRMVGRAGVVPRLLLPDESAKGLLT